MSKNIYQHLEELTGTKASMDYSRLVRKFADAVNNYDEEDLEKEASNQRGKELNERHIDWMQRVVAEELERETDRVDGALPVSSVFEAYQRTKAASAKDSRDIGIRVLATHFEKLWKSDKTANLTVADLLKIKEHYSRNYPKSAASDVIQDISNRGYLTLPVGELVHIASQIRSQEDYDYVIKEAGLTGGNPYQKKARQFILALVNGESEAKQATEFYDYLNPNLGAGDLSALLDLLSDDSSVE